MWIDENRKAALGLLGQLGEELLGAAAAGPVMLVDQPEGPQKGEPRLVVMTAADFDRLQGVVTGLSSALWAAIRDMSGIMGLPDAELAEVLGVAVEDLSEMDEVGGINPLSAAGRRGLYVAEIYRALVQTIERKDLAAWLRSPQPGMDATPHALLLGEDGARRLRDAVVAA